MKIRLLALIALLISGSVIGQQDKLLTHFFFDKMSINPGETGLDEGICATTIYRNQWDKVLPSTNAQIYYYDKILFREFHSPEKQ